MEQIREEWYGSRQEYETDLLAVVTELIEAYLEITENTLFRGISYEGEDKILRNREQVRILRQRYELIEMERYEQKRQLLYEKLEYMAQKAAVSIRYGIVIPLEYLFRIFGADDFLKHCVILALAPELDSRFGSVYASFKENGKQKIPTLDFCIRTYTLIEEYRRELLEIVYENKNKFCMFFKEDKNLLNRKLYLERRILQFLFYMEEDNPNLKTFCRIAYNNELEGKPMVIRKEYADRLAKMMQEKKQSSGVYYIYGPSGVGKRFLVRHVHRMTNGLCYMADAEGLKEDADFSLLDAVIRETLIRGASLCIFHMEALYEGTAYRINAMISHCLEHLPRIFLLSAEKWKFDKPEIPEEFLELEITAPDLGERILLWESELKRADVEKGIDLEGLSAKYSFTPGQITESVKEALQIALWEEKTFDEDILYRACRRQISHRLGEKAALVKAAYDWDDLILPEMQKKSLQNACNQIEYYHQVYEKWGFQSKIAYGRGVSMLFYGPPGTGKTMGAQVMAKELHLELYKVDLSSVMSKYIGETEKNLGAVFEEVKKSQSILFFDEADALFGKRSEVKDAQDKYANAETAYLLQKMEEYEGIVILATNYMQNFDEAFKRRIKFIIEFPFPTSQQRFEIWQKVYPKEAPLSEEIDFEYLSEQFELSGSSIKNIAAASAFLAAAAQSEIEMRHILSCLKEEVKKSGKILHKEDFGEYYYLV